MASNTENLNLLMKNPSTDGADTFNVQTMLNENWQKIDANAGSVAQTLANILKPTTPPIIGLPPSTTPDGMFQALGNTGELHVWRKTVTTAQEIPAGYKLGDAESGTAFSVPNSGSQNYVTLQYGPSITVNDGGGVSLTSVTGSVQFKQYSDVSAIYDIRNNFVKAIPNGDGTSTFDGVIFVPNDCSFKNTAGIVTFGKFYRVNAYPLTPAGTTTTYPVSTNPNAYQEGDDAKAAGYVVGDLKTGRFQLEGYYNSSHPTAYYWADAPTVSDDGVVSIPSGSPTVPGYGFGESSLLSSIRGKYLQCIVDNYTQSDFRNLGVVYIPEDVVVLQYNSAEGVYIDRYQPVTGYAAIPAGTTIEYLGKLGDKARVQVLSYVGTGTYGSSNPNSLTFDFVPKAVFLFSADTYNKCFVAYGDTTGFVFDTDATVILHVSWNGKNISWFNTDNDLRQHNVSGYKYRAIAIG